MYVLCHCDHIHCKYMFYLYSSFCPPLFSFLDIHSKEHLHCTVREHRKVYHFVRPHVVRRPINHNATIHIKELLQGCTYNH